MADNYTVVLSVSVKNSQSGSATVDESFSFNNQSFAKMANLADKFYELITTLQKLK